MRVDDYKALPDNQGEVVHHPVTADDIGEDNDGTVEDTDEVNDFPPVVDHL